MTAVAVARGGTVASPARRRILYIGGWGRSGSTLLARIIAERDGFVFVGEVRDLWHRGVSENRLCGCGRPFLDCPFWSAVGQRAFGGWHRVPAAEMLRLRAVTDRPWWVPVYRAGRLPRPLADDVGRYVEALQRVFTAIHEVTGGHTIIDSSKIPSFVLLLARMEAVDVRILHLVRDARGTVFSWQKNVRRQDVPGQRSSYMLRYRPLSAAARYALYNGQANRLATLGLPYVRVRYEDVITEPEQELDRAAAALGFDSWNAGQLGEGRVRLDVSHTVVGNPMRMATGWLPLRPDTEWQHRMPRGTRLVVSAATAPALRRYGYPLRGP